jgi:hypothetical protein
MWLNALYYPLDRIAPPQFGRQGFAGMNFVTNKVHYFGEMVHFFSIFLGRIVIN